MRPPGGAPGLADYLSATGLPFLHYNMPAMARRLDDLPTIALPDGVEIARVQTTQDQADWLHEHMAGFEEPEAARPDFGQYLAGALGQGAQVTTALLSAGSHVITVQADDGQGGMVTAAVTVTVRGDLAEPSAALFLPSIQK